jgi:hypothetical protein
LMERDTMSRDAIIRDTVLRDTVRRFAQASRPTTHDPRPTAF